MGIAVAPAIVLTPPADALALGSGAGVLVYQGPPEAPVRGRRVPV